MYVSRHVIHLLSYAYNQVIGGQITDLNQTISYSLLRPWSSIFSFPLYLRWSKSFPFFTYGVGFYTDEGDDYKAEIVDGHITRFRFPERKRVSSEPTRRPESNVQILHASLYETDSNLVYDVSSCITDLSTILGNDLALLRLVDVLPLIYQLYHLRYSPPSLVTLTIVFDETYDCQTFKAGERLVFSDDC